MEKNPACRLARRSGTCLRTHLQSWEILEERMGGFSLFYLIIWLWTSGLIFPLQFSGVEEPWPTCVTRFMGNVQQRRNGQQGSVLSLWTLPLVQRSLLAALSYFLVPLTDNKQKYSRRYFLSGSQEAFSSHHQFLQCPLFHTPPQTFLLYSSEEKTRPLSEGRTASWSLCNLLRAVRKYNHRVLLPDVKH